MLARTAVALALLSVVIHAQLAASFYLPGVAPKVFKDGDELVLKVQTLASPESSLQFDYYQLPYCQPEHIVDVVENLGEALAGDKARTSPYIATVKESKYCQTVCRRLFSPQEMEEFQDFSMLEYRANMRLDNLPLAQLHTFAYAEDATSDSFVEYKLGFPVAIRDDASDAPISGVQPVADPDHLMLSNHLRFRILYHPVHESGMSDKSASGLLIVGFQVDPYSVKHTYSGVWNDDCAPNCPLNTCDRNQIVQPHDRIPVSANKGQVEVIFTYDIEWQESDVKWASRWDVYLNMKNDEIHWFSIVNSFIVLAFLSAIVAIILIRILRRDLAMYNELRQDEETSEDIKEETGWKLVYADVFRKPSNAQILSVLAGSGAQLVFMTLLTLGCASTGFLSPSNRGSLVIAFLSFFMLSGVLAGYTSARSAKTLGEVNQFNITVLTSLVSPGVVFTIFFIINFMVWIRGSSGAVPFGTLVAITLLWFCVSVPLTFLGAFLGFRRDPVKFPVRVNSIPRQVPPQPWYLSYPVTMALAGLLPFGAVFVELFFILTSIWQHKFYYMFGFLALVFVIFLITAAEISVVLCYLQLCSEDYKWWWRAFTHGGSAAIYVFLYGVYHWSLRINADDFVSSFVYFGYMTMVCWLLFLAMGFVGIAVCFFFVSKIYGAVKID